ncbi:P-loop containing nucleoside triphosphate hydrolase protein [Naviculisporaceae sp. PSN 640]
MDTRNPAIESNFRYDHRNQWISTNGIEPYFSGSRAGAPHRIAPARDVEHEHSENTTRQFFQHSSATRVNTDAVIATALKKQYPNLDLVVSPTYNVNLIGFAAAGHATYTRIADDDAGSGGKVPDNLSWLGYVPPARRLDGSPGFLAESVQFAKYLYKWKDSEFVLYVVDGRDGVSAYPSVRNNYLLTTDVHKANNLILEAGKWGNELHEEIWVFDNGSWWKSAELFQSVKKATWDAVILDDKMKKSLINDHLSFFDSRPTYTKLKVPWKRGIIYHGPPGNGKTISIKAMMHMLHDREESVPSLYVRNFVSWGGPERAISEIFTKARELAPCYLIFEDLDSLISDQVRSYFLNEVDGLKGNDGIFMIGSTNHLDRLDPGISKRPSRFDRKYYFPDPNMDERIAYAKFWQGKLSDNKDIDFPDELCKAIAEITDGFSFAYMQEAFVAALLAIARRGEDEHEFEKLSISDDQDNDDEGDIEWVDVWTKGGTAIKYDDIKDLVLWIEIQKQVAILREGMDNEQVGGKVRAA